MPCDGWTNGTWQLRFASPVTAVDPDAWLHGPLLVRAVPNPSAGPMHVAFALRERGPVALELYDLAGRPLARHDLGILAPGEHSERLHEAAALPAGLYHVRLVRPRGTLITRVVHLP